MPSDATAPQRPPDRREPVVETLVDTVKESSSVAVLVRAPQARKQGWCLVNQELEEGLISLTAPLLDGSGRTVAALKLSGRANRTSTRVAQETLLPTLLDAARQLSALLAVKGSP